MLLSNITINTTFTFTTGKINTGSNTVIVANSTGTVAGAGAATGWVIGNLRKAVAAGGTFTTANATVELAGSVAQTVPANTFSANTLYNLTVNNPAGAALGGTLNITNTLTISNGSLQTGGYLVLKSSAGTTARVAAITSSAGTPISGNVKVERFVQGRRKYRLLCSSVTTSASAGLSAGQEALSIWGNWQNAGNYSTAGTGTIITGGSTADGYDQQTNFPSLYTYDEAAKKFVAFSSASSKNTKYTPLKAGVGYYLFIYGDRTNSIIAATPNNTVMAATGTLLTGNEAVSILSNGQLWSIEGRKLPQPGDSIRLNMLHLLRPQYTLQIFAQQMAGLPVQPYLHDAYLHTEQALLLSDTNRIAVDINPQDAASAAADRFAIIFRTAAVLDQAFVLFRVSGQSGSVHLEWKCAEDGGIARYLIESSADGSHFSAIREVEAGGGNGVRAYQWIDAAAFTQNSYYRIRMIRKDGSWLSSKIIKVPVGAAKPAVSVYPNPVRGGVAGLEWQQGAQGVYKITLVDGQGREVFATRMYHAGGSSYQSLPVNKNLPAGIYYLKIAGRDIDFHQTILITD